MKLLNSAVAICALTLGASRLDAQSGSACNTGLGGSSGPSSALDACLKARDLFRFFSPQLGVALAGGNPMPGEAGALGGLGKFSLQGRAVVVAGSAPSQSPNVVHSGSPRSEFGSQIAPIVLFSLDVAAGLFKGVPVGLSNVGGVDLLLGATFVPSFNAEAITITTPNAPMALSYGVRVGVLQESAAVPGVDVSYRMRNLAETKVLYARGGDSLSTDDASSKARSVRVTVGKHFSIFGVAGGFGRDMIKSKTAFRYRVFETVPGASSSIAGTMPVTEQEVSRNNAFLNFSLGTPNAQVVFETGRSFKGKPQDIYNSFGDRKANEGYQYFSIGVGVRVF